MKFENIDISNWARKEHFEHYLNNVRCSYSATVNVDITGLRGELRNRGLKVYPAQIYLLTTVANKFMEFRMCLDEEGRLGYWDSIDPLYTVLNSETETFSCVWTQYDENFERFYKSSIAGMAQYATGAFSTQENVPSNVINISSIPWVDFTAFNLNLYTEGDYLLPIFTIGKHIEQCGKTLMPLAIQVHHAVCDGLHVGRFVESVRRMAEDYQQWLG